MINPVTFPNQKVSAAHHGALFQTCLTDGSLSGCGLSYSGSTLYIAPGYLLAAGRLLELCSAESITAAQSSGFARLKGVIDTNQISTETDFRQFGLAMEYAASASGFPALARGEVNSTGAVYEFEVCVLSLGAGGISGIVRSLAPARPRAGSVALSLPVSGWSDNSQTVSAPGISAASLVLTSPAPASWAIARDNGLRCTAQGEGTLTFACDSVPSAAVSYNAAVFG